MHSPGYLWLTPSFKMHYQGNHHNFGNKFGNFRAETGRGGGERGGDGGREGGGTAAEARIVAAKTPRIHEA